MDGLAPLEEGFWARGLRVAGLDEAGRGAWAGPIVVGAVVLPPGVYPFKDSKLLSPKERERLAERVREVALAFALGVAEVEEVDRLGVLKATLLAAARALAGLKPPPEALVTDYLPLPTPFPSSPPQGGPEKPQRGRRQHPGQGPPGPAHGRAGPPLPGLRLRPAQGVRHPGAPGGPPGPGALPRPPEALRPRGPGPLKVS